MSALQKLYDRLRMKVSYATVPKHRIAVRHARLTGYDLAVLANEDVGRQISVLNRYEKSESDFLRSHVRESDICFDVGANIGYYSLLMGIAAPRGRVYAFEPVPINYHLVCLNALLNGCHHICVNQLALGAAEGEASFSQSTDGAFSSLIPVGRKQEAASIKTRLGTLDAFVAEHKLPRIDIMKVDVEGAEMLVVQGGQRVLGSAGTRPRLVLMELYDPNFKAYGTSVKAVVRVMEEFGYAPFVLDAAGSPTRFGVQHHNVHQNVFFVVHDTKADQPS